MPTEVVETPEGRCGELVTCGRARPCTVHEMPRLARIPDRDAGSLDALILPREASCPICTQKGVLARADLNMFQYTCSSPTCGWHFSAPTVAELQRGADVHTGRLPATVRQPPERRPEARDAPLSRVARAQELLAAAAELRASGGVPVVRLGEGHDAEMRRPYEAPAIVDTLQLSARAPNQADRASVILIRNGICPYCAHILKSIFLAADGNVIWSCSEGCPP